MLDTARIPWNNLCQIIIDDEHLEHKLRIDKSYNIIGMLYNSDKKITMKSSRQEKKMRKSEIMYLKKGKRTPFAHI